MQSGKAGSDKWLLKLVEEKKSRSTNNIMGWTSSSNTDSQLKIKFNHKEDAIKYAQEQDYEYSVLKPETAIIKKKSYANNFTA
jgi:hypothetical protein